MLTESTERHQVMLWLKGMSRFPGDFDRAAAINHDEPHQDMRWLKRMSRIRGGGGFPGDFDPTTAINRDWVSSHFGFENNRHAVL